MKTACVLLLMFLLLVSLPGVCLAVEVVDAAICRNVQDRQPVEPGAAFPADVGKIYCWSKIKDGQDTTIKHIYYYDGKEKGAAELQVRSPMFRTYSTKAILPAWTGKWRVDIVDSQGKVLKSLDFTIGEKAQPAEKAQPSAAAPKPEAAPQAAAPKPEAAPKEPAPKAESSK